MPLERLPDMKRLRWIEAQPTANFGLTGTGRHLESERIRRRSGNVPVAAMFRFIGVRIEGIRIADRFRKSANRANGLHGNGTLQTPFLQEILR